MTRPFRFIAPMPKLDQPAAGWRDAVRRREAEGYATVAISDHVSRGWAMDPIVALMAAADATTTLRVLALVLANDFRRPALVHRAIASIDVLSGGRVEVGLGGGWLADDYAALGIELDPPPTRVARLGEAVRLIKRLFESSEPLDFDDDHYTAHGLQGLPTAIQRPRPPIIVGGGGRAVLTLAGGEADIAGVNASLVSGSGRREGITGLTASAAVEKVGWVREAARAAGREADAPELQVSVLETHLTDSPSEASATLDRLATDLDLDRRAIETSPAVLVGSLDHCADLLLERRERFGFSYLKLGPDPAAAAPLVARLAGR
jgi:probable F420-dependent oxidoreductase